MKVAVVLSIGREKKRGICGGEKIMQSQ